MKKRTTRRLLGGLAAAVAIATAGGAVASAQAGSSETQHLTIPGYDPAVWEADLAESGASLTAEETSPDWAPVSLPDGTFASDGRGRFALVNVNLGMERTGLGSEVEAGASVDQRGTSEGLSEGFLIADHLDEFAKVGAVRYVRPGDADLMQWCAVSALATDSCAFGASVEEANLLGTKE